jgi:3-isopropylmalate/(R)-2-methylmalate dehydratase small subunit
MSASATLRTVWHLGDDVDTDALAPGSFMQHGVDVIAQHCLEGLLPRFAADVQRGDLIVAGRNFGIGSSREQAAAALVHLGVAAVIAPSYGGLYFRNAFNLGLVLLTCPEAHRLAQQPKLRLDLQAPSVGLPDGDTVACDPIPDFLLQMALAGGLMANLKLRLASRPLPHTTPPSPMETP